jgi:hypothetical protein
MFNKSLIGAVICIVFVAMLWATVGSKIDFTTGTTPGNPAAGKVRLWGNSGTGFLECLTSAGATCFAAADLTTATGTLGNAHYYGTLGSPSFVQTDESTTSASFVALTTPDSVTFTCAATCNAVVQFSGYTYSVGGNTVDSCAVFVDGSQANDSNQSPAAVTTVQTTISCGWLATSLTSASHTVAVRFKTNSNTAHFLERLLVVSQTP